MKHFSAQYVYTSASYPLKRPVITTTDDGTIINIEDTGGNLAEEHSLEFFNGIIVPGFVNCHCHLELSHLRSAIKEGTGLGSFIGEIRSKRDVEIRTVEKAILQSDNEMFSEGIVLCADVCNSSVTFNPKTKSKIRYINLLEVFGIDSSKAEKRINEILAVAAEAEKNNLNYYIVPHSAYSVSEQLFKIIKEISYCNKISSIHFLESGSERTFLESHSGPIAESYSNFGILFSDIHTVKNHTEAVLNNMTSSGSLLLVHNTFVSRKEIRTLIKRNDLYWCICPGSNLFIEKKMPPVELLLQEGCELVIGTDSKGSNESLSILNEIRTIQNFFPSIPVEMLIRWATINGARSLGEDSWAGSIEPGKKPGLLLIDNFDFTNQRFSKESKVKRLI
jgi:cytosine/adenosine deaminase-related metal-dependent hydrolase